jgi:hypothetical protein
MARQGPEVGKKVRFEVFKRDNFKCQYCGKGSPDVILHLDHIKPKDAGGGNDIPNLITSCQDCNLGKGARLLDDKTVVAKQREQLEELQERREQLEMMLQWREGLMSIEDDKLNRAREQYETRVRCRLTEVGVNLLRKWIKQYDFAELLDAIDTSTAQYLVPEGDWYTRDSLEKAFNFIPRILNVQAAEKDKPYLRDLFYIRGILRKRLAYCDERKALQLLESAHLAGATIPNLKSFACEVRNWTKFQTGIYQFLADHGADDTDGPIAE